MITGTPGIRNASSGSFFSANHISNKASKFGVFGDFIIFKNTLLIGNSGLIIIRLCFSRNYLRRKIYQTS